MLPPLGAGRSAAQITSGVEHRPRHRKHADDADQE
jgi:hypothetical protein